jgi:hypothetical protein
LKPFAVAHHGSMSMHEPGLDKHEWESIYATLEEELADDPRAALPELADLVERMLESRGYQLDEPVTVEGEERDVVAEYLAAREVSDRVERDEDVDPGDIAAAIEGLRSLYDYVIVELATP